MGGRLAKGAMRTGDSWREARAPRTPGDSRRGELVLDVLGRFFCSFRGVCWVCGVCWRAIGPEEAVEVCTALGSGAEGSNSLS